jgi:hypothetical protein
MKGGEVGLPKCVHFHGSSAGFVQHVIPCHKGRVAAAGPISSDHTHCA